MYIRNDMHESASLVCKFCQSQDVVKHGRKGTAQRYLCNACKHHFVANGNTFPRMRSNEHVIVTGLNLYFEGLSARKVQKQMKDIYGEELSQTTIWSWVQKYSKLAAEYAKTLTPQVSGKIHHDETQIKVDGTYHWFWEALDGETRFIVASHISGVRNHAETFQMFKKIKEGCGAQPQAIFVDGSNSYDLPFDLAFNYEPQKVAKVEMVKRVGIRARETNNIVERLHSTLKMRTGTMRGMKGPETAKVLLDGWVTHYNFCREHMSLKMTPAQAAGLEVKGWKSLIREAQAEKTKAQLQEKEALQIEVKVN